MYACIIQELCEGEGYELTYAFNITTTDAQNLYGLITKKKQKMYM